MLIEEYIIFRVTYLRYIDSIESTAHKHEYILSRGIQGGRDRMESGVHSADLFQVLKYRNILDTSPQQIFVFAVHGNHLQ